MLGASLIRRQARIQPARAWQRLAAPL